MARLQDLFLQINFSPSSSPFLKKNSLKNDTPFDFSEKKNPALEIIEKRLDNYFKEHRINHLYSAKEIIQKLKEQGLTLKKDNHFIFIGSDKKIYSLNNFIDFLERIKDFSLSTKADTISHLIKNSSNQKVAQTRGVEFMDYTYHKTSPKISIFIENLYFIFEQQLAKKYSSIKVEYLIPLKRFLEKNLKEDSSGNLIIERDNTIYYVEVLKSHLESFNKGDRYLRDQLLHFYSLIGFKERKNTKEGQITYWDYTKPLIKDEQIKDHHQTISLLEKLKKEIQQTSWPASDKNKAKEHLEQLKTIQMNEHMAIRFFSVASEHLNNRTLFFHYLESFLRQNHIHIIKSLPLKEINFSLLHTLDQSSAEISKKLQNFIDFLKQHIVAAKRIDHNNEVPIFSEEKMNQYLELISHLDVFLLDGHLAFRSLSGNIYSLTLFELILKHYFVPSYFRHHFSNLINFIKGNEQFSLHPFQNFLFKEIPPPLKGILEKIENVSQKLPILKDFSDIFMLRMTQLCIASLEKRSHYENKKITITNDLLIEGEKNIFYSISELLSLLEKTALLPNQERQNAQINSILNNFSIKLSTEHKGNKGYKIPLKFKNKIEYLTPQKPF